MNTNPGDWIVRYAEIALKGKNRPLFEKALMADLARRLAASGSPPLTRARGRIWIRTDAPLADILRTVPGVHSFGRVWRCDNSLEALEHEARARLRDVWDGATPLRFRITTRRGDKRYPLDSTAVNACIGAALLQQSPAGLLKVDLNHPQAEICIELYREYAALYTRLEPGPGGLPVGSSGPVLGLLSGGIDSPVAAWQMIRRGCRVHFVFFENQPFLGRAARGKVERLAALLAGIQGETTLTIIPFDEIQTAIHDACSARNRVILYRRCMYRIAERIMIRKRLRGLVTGENLGQVASQTLDNLQAVDVTVRACVYRPLICMDKQEIVALAEQLGTFAISIEPGPDCCSVFLPRHPATRAGIRQLEDDEARLDLARLETDALEHAECLPIGSTPGA